MSQIIQFKLMITEERVRFSALVNHREKLGKRHFFSLLSDLLSFTQKKASSSILLMTKKQQQHAEILSRKQLIT